jgi:purine-binding chemotaxis protein CheW
MVIFRVGAEEFALDIMHLKEVVVMRSITAVPETENFVEGVMNLRGSLVPVLDLRKRLRAIGVGDSQDKRIIVSNLEGRLVGLIVDGASEVIRVGEEMIEAAPDIITEMGVGYVAGIINLGTRFITMIDLKKALSEEITHELEEVIKAVSLDSGVATSVRAVQ